MTLHKLRPGLGTPTHRHQVAAHDATERSQAGLAEYYTERGESPGRWLGSGLPNLGLAVADEVIEEQMVALFGQRPSPREAELGVVPLPLAAPSRPTRRVRCDRRPPRRSRRTTAARATRPARRFPPTSGPGSAPTPRPSGSVVQQGRAPADDRELAGSSPPSRARGRPRWPPTT
ncbi:MAG: relaxase domain-containing protein [Nocardioidaceae bacterium]